ncbi:FIG006045: Sigma factor, ECF subfamily [plant metagenome]|uniref:FIG006045: Sigma factor, ECF subfamily n=1 Tax=plant metagenome TaxID=1297885 RepID=A0A484R6U5_9ZZZZ
MSAMPLPPAAKKGWLAHYSEIVAGWRRKVGVHEDSEDAMHDAVVRLLENGAAAVNDPRAYLKRSTANGVIDRHRHQAVLPTTPLHELEEYDHPLASGPEAEVLARRLVADLKEALADLPAVCQHVYIRHRLEGWTHAEIAQGMGISRAMVEKHMTRALQHLNRRLQHHAP